MGTMIKRGSFHLCCIRLLDSPSCRNSFCIIHCAILNANQWIARSYGSSTEGRETDIYRLPPKWSPNPHFGLPLHEIMVYMPSLYLQQVPTLHLRCYHHCLAILMSQEWVFLRLLSQGSIEKKILLEDRRSWPISSPTVHCVSII